MLAEHIRRDIDQVESLLIEAQHYDAMFSEIFRIAAPFEERNAAVRMLITSLKGTIKHARKQLKKNDRVVWYYRMIRLSALVHLDDQLHGMIDKTYFDKIFSEYQRQSGRNPIEDIEYIDKGLGPISDRFLSALEHFFSLPIPAIQDRVFKFDDPREVIYDFEKAEEAWQEEVRSALSTDGSEPIIEFSDGWAWFDLKKAACSKEASAMGHCGNSPRSGTTDTILSLRKPITHNGLKLWKPYLTFILHSDGMLGEMKGRFNKKPEAELHPKIVALLYNPIIEGIRGGGYLPQNNFKIADLDPAVAEELLEVKPELASLEEMYLKYGIEDSRVRSLLNTRLEETGCRVDELTLDETATVPTFIIDRWNGYEAFVQRVDDKIVKGLFDAIENDEPIEITKIDRELIYDVITAMSDQERSSIYRELGLRYRADIAPHVRHREMSAAIEYITPATRVWHRLADAVGRVVSSSLVAKDQYLARIREYAEIGYPLQVTPSWIEIDASDLDAAVVQKIHVEDLIGIVNAESSDDTEEAWEQNVAQEHGWDNIEWEYTDNLREEANLIKRGSGRQDQNQDTLVIEYDPSKLDPRAIVDAYFLLLNAAD